MRGKTLLCVVLATAMITGTLGLILPPKAAGGLDFIKDLGSPPATYRSAVWHPDGDFMLAVGNDSGGNGIIDKLTPGSGWTPMHTVANANFNAITSTEPYVWYDGMENGQNGWSTTTWSGDVTWQLVDPSGLPNAPTSGTSHGNANSGNFIWWFGNQTTGGYGGSSGTKFAASLYSPVMSLPGESTWAALSIHHWFEVEYDGAGNYDHMYVSIKNTTDSGWTLLKRWDCSNQSFTKWRQEIMPIAGWLGNDISLNFTFDTKDNLSNDYAGWHLDDILVYANDLYVAVGEPGGTGYSGYFLDGYGSLAHIGLNTVDFNDVAAGSLYHSFLAVGDGGAAYYWFNNSWYQLIGPAPDETLTGIDFNGTHFFIVGYNSAGRGVAYYFIESELFHGYNRLHPILGGPNWELNDIAWNNNYPGLRGNGLGAIAANGTVMSISNPEIWIRQHPPSPPPARLGHDMVYVPTQGYFVMFGGSDGAGYFNDTWVYSAFTGLWYNFTSWPAPSPRYGHSMVYDSNNDRIILFGGSGPSGLLGDTWEYHPGNNTWHNITVPGSPSPRYRHDMVYDSANDRVLLFGGDTGGFNGESWEYSGGLWTNHTSDVGLAPSPRVGFKMVFDDSRNATVLFGGQSASGLMNDTWVFSSNTNQWINRSPVKSPLPRFRHSMAYDPRNDRVILFGGYDGSGNRNDTWLYDALNNKWYNPYPGTRPLPRRDAALAYDSASHDVKYFGGTNGTVLNDTWAGSISTAWNGDVDNPARATNGENFTAVAWDNSETDALFIGNDASGGVVYQFKFGNDYISKVPGLDGVLAGHELYDVSYFPHDPSNRAVLLGGSAFLVNPEMVDSGTQLTVNADFPHIFSIDFREQATGISRLDQQVDVGAAYTFFVEANYTVGGVDRWNDASIDIVAWYDEGHVGLATTPETNWNTEYNRTRQFNITFDVSTSLVTLTYPAAPQLEFTIFNAWENPNVYPGDRHRVYINVTFGEQARVADGQGFASGGPVGGRIWDRAAALNDQDSWDFMVRIYDDTLTTAFNESYGEFGIKEYVAISVAGNPAGNAPPGTVSNPMSNPSQITYSANTQYWVNVSIPNLLKGGTGPDLIAATNVNVSNSNILSSDTYSDINGAGWPMGRPFAAANTPWSAWGNSTTSQWMPVPGNGTVSFGPWGSDYNAGWVSGGAATTQLDWWVTVPAGTPEGIYSAIITVEIDT